MKQFCKSLRNDGECWKMLYLNFPKLSDAKLKVGIFTGPDIRKLLCDLLFPESMNERENEAWESIADVVHNFLGNRKDDNYKKILERMLTAYEAQGCKMTLNVYFLHSHLEYLKQNLRVYSEEQGKGSINI